MAAFCVAIAAEISAFQSLMISLAGRVGVGNIAGVATAIAFGGPGAVFWMWAVALLGSATSFVECTLAQIYKEQDRDTGEYRGGPAYYIEKAIESEVEAIASFEDAMQQEYVFELNGILLKCYYDEIQHLQELQLLLQCVTLGVHLK